jgi:hypothetical protein
MILHSYNTPIAHPVTGICKNVDWPATDSVNQNGNVVYSSFWVMMGFNAILQDFAFLVVPYC